MEYELYHYGVRGMKWGVRRYQNADGTLTSAGKRRASRTIDRINSMYDHSNKWTNRKIERLTRKGKTAKADVMKEMIKQNESARETKVSAIRNMNAEQYNAAKRSDIKDTWLGGQNYMKRNALYMTTPLSRINEYTMQRGMRWASNYTWNSTLARMSPSEGYSYLDNKSRVAAALRL
jgi:hypothetical protein